MIEGKEKPLRKVFSNDYLFRIPSYQRPYAWGIDEAGDLLDDFLYAMEESTSGDDTEPYFLGSIVLIKPNDKQPQADVVDGQQRLTTLTILFAALRTQVEGKLAESITKRITEEGDALAGTDDRFRLTIRARDNDFFERYIQRAETFAPLRKMEEAQLSDSQKNIRRNALHYVDRLADLGEKEISRLARFIDQNCYLVIVSTDTEKSAYRIFSVLNDRGMNLSHTDILKAEILGEVDEHERQEYADRWENMEEALGRDAFADLFGHIRMIHRRKKRGETLVEEIRAYVRPSERPKKFITEELQPYVGAFSIIRSESYKSQKHAEAINQRLKWLNRIDNSDWLPPTIVYLEKHHNNPQRLLPFLQAMERLAAGMMMYRARVNKRIKRYAKVLNRIDSDNGALDPDSPIHLGEEEELKVLKAITGDLYESKRIRKYALLRLDAALSEGVATYDHDILTVEHVLPQNPKPDSTWTEWFSDAELRNHYIHKVGNLALLSRRRNTSASNYDFERKKEKYFKTKGSVSAFALTTQVVSRETWTPEIVESRQEELIDVFKDIWDLHSIPEDTERLHRGIPRPIDVE